MLSKIQLILYGVAALLVLGAGAYVYHSIYEKGAHSVEIREEKAFKKLEDKTDAAKDSATTTDDPAGELRKFERPGP